MAPALRRHRRRHQRRPRHRRHASAGLRHPDRAVVRAGAHHPRPRPALPPPPAAGPRSARTAGPSTAPASTATTTPTSAPRSARTATTTPGRSRSTGTPPNCGAGSPSPCAAASPTSSASPAPSCASSWSRCQFAKVAEFQRRGVVHFHALVRLDGPGDGYPPPAVPVTVEQLADAIQRRGRRGAPWSPSPTSRAGRPGNCGSARQLDVRPVHGHAQRDASAGPMHPEMVAAYIAKYATKAAEDFGLAPQRIHPLTDLDGAARLRPHPPAPRRPPSRSARPPRPHRRRPGRS